MINILGKNFPAPSWSTTLLIDAMYYHAAKNAFEVAMKSLKNIRDARKGFFKLRVQEAEILDRFNGDSWKAYDNLEPIYIQMEDAEYEIGASYGPYLQNISLTHILCVTTLEAYINILAKGSLSGKFWDNFNRISIEAKWLFLPKILGKITFNQGSEPFQSFSNLIKFRNELVHYKGVKENWHSFEKGLPNFLNKLGLSLPKARKSLKTVREMIISISAMIEKKPPFWLREGYDELDKNLVSNFFETTIRNKQN